MIWLLWLSTLSWSAPVECPAHLTAEDAHRARAVEYTRELNAIYYPLLERIARHAMHMDDARLAFQRARADAIIRDIEVYDRTFPFLYDGAYPRRFEVWDNSLYGDTVRPLKAPYTKFSRAVMRRFVLALSILQFEIQDNEVALARAFDGHEEFLKIHSYAGTKLPVAIYYAHQSLLSAVAQFVSGTVNRLPAAKLSELVTREHAGRASPVVQFALALPPRAIGQYGERFFLRRSLQKTSSGRLILSKRTRKFLEGRREYFAAQPILQYEFGKGCPVGHCLPDKTESGLQLYLDAVLGLMERLDQTRSAIK